MQISIYVINNMPEPGRNLAADACMGRTQLSPCIYNFGTRTIRASRNAMPAWYFFHAEPLICRFSLEKYITLLQQLWQTVLMWNLYPIFISLNQLAVKITPAESFLWMHLHQFQYLCPLTDVNPHFTSPGCRYIISKLTADSLLWRHRHMGQPLTIVTSQWPIVPTGIYERMRSARVKGISDPLVSTRGIASTCNKITYADNIVIAKQLM